MYLTIHSTVGVIIGEQVNNIGLAFVLGFISHFIVDMIPHGDKSPKIKRTFEQRRATTFKLGTIDAITMTIVLLLLWQSGLIDHPLSAFAGAAGGIMPDLLVGVYLLTAHPVLKKFYSFHMAGQKLIKSIEYPHLPGLIFQFVILTGLIFLLSKL